MRGHPRLVIRGRPRTPPRAVIRGFPFAHQSITIRQLTRLPPAPAQVNSFSSNRLSPPTTTMLRGVMARLQAARTLLQSAPSEQHARISNIQMAAVIEQLQAHGLQKKISAEDQANISEIVLSTNYCDDHSGAILAKLTGVPQTRKRQGQDFTAWMSYAYATEWALIMSDDADDISIIHLCVDIVMRRLRCINPSEDTKKMITNVVLARGKTRTQVFGIPLWKKQSFHNSVKTRITYLKARLSSPEHYMMKLPADLATLQRECPSLYNEITTGSDQGFGTCPIDGALIAAIDSSYSSRGSGLRGTGNLIAAMGTGPTAASAERMLVNCIPQVLQPLCQNQNNEIPLHLNSRKRSLSALTLLEDDQPSERTRVRASLGLPALVDSAHGSPLSERSLSPSPSAAPVGVPAAVSDVAGGNPAEVVAPTFPKTTTVTGIVEDILVFLTTTTITNYWKGKGSELK